MENATRQFANIVEEFLAFVESKPNSPEDDLVQTIRLLKKLLAGVEPLIDLQGLGAKFEDAPDCDKEHQNQVAARFSHLPFQYYNSVYTPYEEQDVGGGLIAGEMAEIYSELWGGYQLYKNGNEGDAVWEWKFLYSIHWGRHATSVLYALDAYRCDNFIHT